MSNPDFVIYISQYAYNVLETMDKMRRKEQNKGVTSSSNQTAAPGEILYDLRNNIKIADNLTLEAYSHVTQVHIVAIHQRRYAAGRNKQDKLAALLHWSHKR